MNQLHPTDPVVERVNARPQKFDLHETVEIEKESQILEFVDETATGKPENVSSVPTIPPAPDTLPNQDIINILERDRPIGYFTWQTNQDADTMLLRSTFPEALFGRTIIWHKIQSFCYLRGGLRFYAKCNGTALHYGQLLLVWRPLALGKSIPFPTSSLSFGPYDNIVSLSQLPHVLVSPNERQSAVLSVPWLYPYDYIPIQAYGQGTGKDVTRVIFNQGVLEVWVINPLKSEGSANDPPVEVTIFAAYENPSITAFTHSTLEYTPTPLSVNTSHPVLGTLSENVPSTQARIENPGLQTYQSFQPVDLASGMSSQPMQSMTEVSLEAPVPVETPLQSQLSTWSYLTTTNITGAQTTDTVLLRLPVTPTLCRRVSYSVDGNKVGLAHTKLSYLSSFFTQWKGPIEYRFDFVASKFHSTRLRIAWNPPLISSNASAYEIPDDLSMVVDIQGETSVIFTVPWTIPTAYLPLINSNWNGVLSISILNPLTYPSSPIPPIFCNVWIRGPEVKFNQIISNENNRIFTYDTVIMREGDNVLKSEDLHETQASKEEPEPPSSLDSLIHKFSPLYTIQSQTQLKYAPLEMPFRSSSIANHEIRFCTSLLQRLSLLSIGFRGSLLFNVPLLDSEFVAIPLLSNRQFLINKATSTASDLISSYAFQPMLYFPPSQNAIKSFRLPLFSSMSFIPVSPFSQFGHSWSNLAILQIFNPSTMNIPLLETGGPDFAFIGVNPAPVLFRMTSREARNEQDDIVPIVKVEPKKIPKQKPKIVPKENLISPTL